MAQYVVRRVVYGLVTVLAVSIITFWLVQNTGADALDRLRGNPRIQPETIREMSEYFGLDRPPAEQYLTWAKNFVQVWNYPDAWGQSFTGSGLVQERVFEKVLGTLRLMVTALLLALIIGIPLGIYQAIKQYSFLDQTATTASFITFSTPIFVVGIGLQIPLSALPGALDRGEVLLHVRNEQRQLQRPLVLGEVGRLGTAPGAASDVDCPDLHRGVLAVPAGNHARGAPQRLHAHRQGEGSAAPHRHSQARTAQRADPDRHPRLIGHRRTPRGAVITESIFGWPGMGRLYIEAINFNDWPIIMALVVVISFMVVVMNLLADLAYGWLDPRVRYE